MLLAYVSLTGYQASISYTHFEIEIIIPSVDSRILIQCNLYLQGIKVIIHSIINHKEWMFLQIVVECFEQICSWFNLSKIPEILCMESYEPACSSNQGVNSRIQSIQVQTRASYTLVWFMTAAQPRYNIQCPRGIAQKDLRKSMKRLAECDVK